MEITEKILPFPRKSVKRIYLSTTIFDNTSVRTGFLSLDLSVVRISTVFNFWSMAVVRKIMTVVRTACLSSQVTT